MENEPSFCNLKSSAYTADQTPIIFSRIPIQAKLTIGQPNDKYEREADRMADRVMEMPESKMGSISSGDDKIQRKCAECEKDEEEEKIQMKPLASQVTPFGQRPLEMVDEGENMVQTKAEGGVPAVAPSFQSRLNISEGGGSPLPKTTNQFMSNAFGTDFNHVRIHNDSGADQMNKDVHAKAFTHGSDIYFKSGQYSPESSEGKRLLAHELTHTLQQDNGTQRQIQRLGPAFGPAVSGPSDWESQVRAATNSAQKAALIQSVVGSNVTVNDATAASASDRVPDPAHLRPFSLAAPVINFDENLTSKNARTNRRQLNINAGYTFQHRTAYYVVIGNLALDGTNYNQTIQTINHEFDHINQYLRRSTLTGNESELDAWTNTFIREFHHSYQFRATRNGTTCYLELNSAFAPLLMYYQLVTNAAQHTSAVSRIAAYYTATIRPNVANTHAFRYWVFRSMGSANNPALGTDVNSSISLNINPSDSATTFRAIPCSSVTPTSLPGGSVIVIPTAPRISQGT
jgi:hypothetical protein